MTAIKVQMLMAMMMFHAIGWDAGADALAVEGASSAGRVLKVWPCIASTGVEDALVDGTTGTGTAAAVAVASSRSLLILRDPRGRSVHSLHGERPNRKAKIGTTKALRADPIAKRK